MLVKPLPSYGCLTCGFRCLSSQMIQLHWRHWHQAFIAPAPAKQGDPFKQPEAVSDSRMTTSPVSSSSSNQSKHPTKLGVATFKDKSVDSTGKHWAVRFGSATASCNSKTYTSFTVYSVRQTIPAIQHSGYAPTHPFRNSSVRLSILHQEILPKFRPEKTHIRSHG